MVQNHEVLELNMNFLFHSKRQGNSWEKRGTSSWFNVFQSCPSSKKDLTDECRENMTGWIRIMLKIRTKKGLSFWSIFINNMNVNCLGFIWLSRSAPRWIVGSWWFIRLFLALLLLLVPVSRLNRQIFYLSHELIVGRARVVILIVAMKVLNMVSPTHSRWRVLHLSKFSSSQLWTTQWKTA